MINKFLKPLLRYRVVLILALVGLMFGFTLYKLSLINQPQTDTQYLNQQQSTKITKINIDPDLRMQLEQLVSTPVDTTPRNLGQQDPFNP